jgi:ParB-like chromosome segregation protein Spo0J
MTTYIYEGEAQLIPIQRIRPVKLIKRGLPRLQEKRDLMAAGRPLPPLALFDHEGELLLADGMHRYTVAKEMGFTHLPCVFWTSAWPIDRNDWE